MIHGLIKRNNLVLRKLFLLIVFLVILSFSIFGCAKKIEVVKIGVPIPLSGSAASYGEKVKMGIDVAQNLINDQGGINGNRVELVFGDTKCEAKTALELARKMLDVDQVDGLVGSVCSGATIPVADLSAENKFILIASAASKPQVVESPYAFRVNPNDFAQAQSIAEYIEINLSYVKVAILSVNDEYGKGLVDTFANRFKSLGGKVSGVEFFAVETSDFRPHITKLETVDFEILFIIAHSSHHPQIAKELSELGKNWIRIADFNFGVMSDDLKNLSMRGTIYPTVLFDVNSTPNAKLLNEQIKIKYQKEADIVTAWGFDTLYVFSQAASKCKVMEPECIRQNLAGLEFDGAAGRNKLTAGGEIEQPPFIFVGYGE